MEEITLPEHEKHSEQRAQRVIQSIEGEKAMESGIHDKVEVKNIFETAKGGGMDMGATILPMLMGSNNSGVGAGAGAGLGAGLLGGILGGALLNNRGGLFNNGNGEGGNFVTPTQLQTGLDAVITSNQNTTILQTLGDIKAAVPLAEAQVQLALAGAQADINSNISTSLQTAINGQGLINKNISDAIATSLASQSAIKETVLTTGAANLTATMNAKFELANVVRDDGDKTRALITSQYEATLNRQLATAEAALLEQRAIGRSRDVEVNVTQTVNQNQLQLQAQQQQQQQFIVLNNIANLLGGLQNAVATNSNLIVGNSGPVGTGSQTANPVNVRT